MDLQRSYREYEAVVDVRCGSEEMRKLACERRIPILADFLQSSRLHLRDDPDFVAERNKSRLTTVAEEERVHTF